MTVLRDRSKPASNRLRSAASGARELGLRIGEQVLFSTVGEEAVLLDLRSGRYFGLDGVGTRFWSLLASGCKWSEILEILGAEYDVSPERLSEDLMALIDRLTGCGLLETDD